MRIIKHIFLLALLMTTPLFSGRAFSNDGAYDQETFVKELLEQHQQIRKELKYNCAAFECVEIDGVEKTSYVLENRKYDDQHISSVRYETIVTDNPEPWHAELVHVTNPKYSFTIKRRNKNEDWTIDNVQELNKGNSDNFIRAMGNSVHGDLYINTISIASLINSEGVEIEAFEEKELDGEPAVYLTLRIKDPESEIDSFYVGYNKVELLFLPKKYGYAPKEYTSSRNDVCTRVVYDQFQQVGTFFIPSSSQAFFKPKDEPYENIGSTTVTYAQRDLKKSEFYLSHYGLPEPDFTFQINRIRLALVVIGALMVGLGGWRIYRKRVTH